ncbi:leucine-rich repeat-containing protein 15-like [Periplaneta americana]|uniref:leucine-rich repeat-containing protein 15-like n=1 Tax=Periplaneta americana TaxID=6978 RepID=UPI0037E98467
MGFSSTTSFCVWRWIGPLLLCALAACHGCSDVCKCYAGHDRSITADCTRRNLTQLPVFLSDVAQLLMSHNDMEILENLFNSSGNLVLNAFWADAAGISEIKPGAFYGMNQMTILSLRYNIILDLKYGVFEGLENLKELMLQGNRIKILKSQVFVNLVELTELYLDNNLIETVSYDSFLGLRSLKILSLANNFLADLLPETFYGLKTLIDLRLHRNKLTVLDPKLFKTLEKLRILRLNHNMIDKFLPGIFSDLHEMTILNLNGNLLINLQHNISNVNLNGTSVQSQSLEIFATTSKLVYVHLRDNRLEKLEQNVMKDLESLKYLDVTGNMLTKLGKNTFLYNTLLVELRLSRNIKLTIPKKAPFLNISSLKYLHLSGCNIKSLSESALEYLPKLQNILLDNNKLKTLKRDMLVKLKDLSKMSLHDNPLECNCQLKPTWEWCRDNNILTNKEPVCIKPRSLQGKYWDELQFLECTSPEKDSSFKTFHFIFEPLVFAFILLAGAVGTGALLLIFASYERILEIPNTCIFSIAVADFIMLMVFLPMSYTNAFSQVWKFGLPMCKIFMFTHYLIIGAAVFSVMVLAYHSYTSTIIAFQTRNCGFGSSSRTAAFHLFAIWLIAGSLAFPAIISATIENDICKYAPEYYGPNFIPRAILIQLLIYSLLPMIFIILMYIVTERYMVLKSIKFSGKINEKKMFTRRKLSRIVLSLTLVFFISYAPNIFMKLLISWSFVNQDLVIVKVFVFLTDCLFYSITWLYPLAIYISCDIYRGHFKRVIYCERFRKHPLKRKNTPSYTADSGLGEHQTSVLEMRY